MFLRIRRRLFNLIQKIKVRPGRNKLLIVRLDAIGDYVLFRNAFSIIKESEKYKNYRITLLGNSLWKDLGENLDQNVIDEFLWIDPVHLYDENSYSIQKIFLFTRLKFQGFKIIFHPVHSRMIAIDNFLAALQTPHLIGSSGDTINYNEGEKNKADQFYTELIPVPGYSEFEFFRNGELVSKFIGEPSKKMNLEILFSSTIYKECKIIISPGAGHARRKWPAEHFATLITMITKSYPSAFFYICGSQNDSESARIISSLSPGCQVKDMTGKLSLFEFTKQLHESALLISNESSAIHLAAAVNTPAVCISNGNMFGRFNPYPPHMNKKIITIYSDNKFYDQELYNANVEMNRIYSDSDISLLKPEQVYTICKPAIENVLHQFNC